MSGNVWNVTITQQTNEYDWYLLKIALPCAYVCFGKAEKASPQGVQKCILDNVTIFFVVVFPRPLPFFGLWFVYNIASYRSGRAAKNREGL